MNMANAFPKNTINTESLEEMNKMIYDEGIAGGWILPNLTTFELFHYFAKSNVVRSSSTEHLPNDPSKPFVADPTTKVNFYLNLRCAAEVFEAIAPIIGGLPQTTTQDQCHWLQKVLKSSMLSCKPIRLGNYLVLFSLINKVDKMGPSYGLVRRDIDVSNKTDQRSAERIIAEPVISGLNECEWSLETSFYIRLAKEGFEAWWNPKLSPIERISQCYMF